MDNSKITEITKDANDLLATAVEEIASWVHIPAMGHYSDKERHDLMLDESREFHEETESFIRHWLEHGDFKEPYDEEDEVIRQTFWRLAMADDYLTFFARPFLLDASEKDKSPKALLHALLIRYWGSDSQFADEYFHYLAAGEKKFPRPQKKSKKHNKT